MPDAIWEITLPRAWAACQENVTERAIRRELYGEGDGIMANGKVTSSSPCKHRLATPTLGHGEDLGTP